MPIIHINMVLPKKKKISAINDTSVLDPGIEPCPGGDLCVTNYYVFGYWFWEKPLLVVMLFLFGIGVTAIIATFGVNGRWEFLIVGLSCLILLRKLWRYSFIHKYKKFIVFDQKTGIVHIPKRFGKKYDRILFKDASFVMVDRYTTILGLSRSTYFYLLRPGWDLIHDGWIKNTYSLIELSTASNEFAQKIWAFLVEFMAGRYKRHFYTLKEAQNGRPNFAKFDPSKLETDLTWTRDENGKWHKVKPIK